MSRRVYVVAVELAWGSKSYTSWPTLDLAHRAMRGLEAQGFKVSCTEQAVSL